MAKGWTWKLRILAVLFTAMAAFMAISIPMAGHAIYTMIVSLGEQWPAGLAIFLLCGILATAIVFWWGLIRIILKVRKEMRDGQAVRQAEAR
jgi:hypothetical protein